MYFYLKRTKSVMIFFFEINNKLFTTLKCCASVDGKCGIPHRNEKKKKVDTITRNVTPSFIYTFLPICLSV